MFKIELKVGPNKTYVGDCPDAACYIQCATSCLGILGTAAQAGAAGGGGQQAKPGNDHKSTYVVTDDSGKKVFCAEFTIHGGGAAAAAAEAAFDACVSQPHMAKIKK